MGVEMSRGLEGTASYPNLSSVHVPRLLIKCFPCIGSSNAQCKRRLREVDDVTTVPDASACVLPQLVFLLFQWLLALDACGRGSLGGVSRNRIIHRKFSEDWT
jgi:hypothetical protein